MNKAQELLREVKGSKVPWREDNVGGWEAETSTRYSDQWKLHANENGWMAARSERLMGSGKASGLDDAKEKAVAFLKQAEIRGL